MSVVGTAYRIRTGDLRLERAASWASRRMRPRRRWRSTAQAGRHDTSDPVPPSTELIGSSLQAVGFQEPPDGVGDLLETRLAGDQPIVRMRGERLVRSVEPLGQTF